MPLDGLNAAAALAILNNAGVDNDVKMRGVLLASFTQGLVGLAVPIALANNATTTSRATPVATVAQPVPVIVPELVTKKLSADAATEILKQLRLFAEVRHTYGGNATKDQVVLQAPAPGTLAALDSTVTIFVSLGDLPPPVVIDPIASSRADIHQALRDISGAVERIDRDVAPPPTVTQTAGGPSTPIKPTG